MKIGFFSPYLETLGGGERYTLTLASHWSKSYDVRIFLDDESLLHKASDRFDLDLSKVNVVENVFQNSALFKKLIVTKTYDCIFFLTDGSIPSSLARFNILHFQVPFAHIEKNPIKLFRFQAIICNSMFTLNHMDSGLMSRAKVIYPPIEVNFKKKQKKENIILSVGGFRGGFEPKKQSILIDTFIKGYKTKILHSWALYLAGSLHDEDKEYFFNLKKKAKGFPIFFCESLPLARLHDLYNKASIYWHAAGFNEENPERMEHFGMTTVEAMGAGCIPIVYMAGGQREIIKENINGLFWKTPTELLHHTQDVLRNKIDVSGLRKNAAQEAQKYSVHTFTQNFDQLLSKIIHG